MTPKDRKQTEFRIISRNGQYMVLDKQQRFRTTGSKEECEKYIADHTAARNQKGR